MSTGSPPLAQPVSAQVRLVLREVIARWNRSLDRGDLVGLRALSVPALRVGFDGRAFDGEVGVAEFVATHGSTAEVARRMHVNHLQAWYEEGHIRSRSLAMVVELVGATSPHGDGAPAVGWVGYAEDIFVENEAGLRVLSREFRRWGGEVLRRFPDAARARA